MLFLVPFSSSSQIALVATSVISLTYSLEDGKDYNGIFVRNGQANMSKLECYYHAGSDSRRCPWFPVIEDQLAHAYGETTLGGDSDDPNDCGDFTDTQSIIDSKRDFRYYCHRELPLQKFGFRFNQYNPEDRAKAYPYFTDRVITASSGPCNEYTQIGDDGEETQIGNPKSGPNFISAYRYAYTNGTFNGTITIPTSALGNEGTTYIYRDKAIPPAAGAFAHGPRGLWMWAYRNGGHEDPLFYECPITVDPVTNVHDKRHDISDAVARRAVASIALQGQWKGPLEAIEWTQWQWYAAG